MGHLRVALAAIAAVLLVGCSSGPATEPAKGTATNLDKKVDVAKPGGGAGVQAQAGTAQLGPGAMGADSRIGTKVK